jgi:hypothetical protein
MRCDGCGAPAQEEHLRRRIERLELATRFRPIHIGILFLNDAPPANMLDYFYCASAGAAKPQGVARAFFEGLLAAAGIARESQDTQKQGESLLADFQRAGFFLADCVECPFEELGERLDPEQLASRYAATVVKRILYSYKPRAVAMLSRNTRGVIPVLEQAGLADRLLLDDGGPFYIPPAEDLAAQQRFVIGLGETIRRAIARVR